MAVEYKKEWYIVEIKLLRKGRSFEKVKSEGLKQITRYSETFKPPIGFQKNIKGIYLIIFDRRPEDIIPSWNERISWEQEGNVTVLGC